MAKKAFALGISTIVVCSACTSSPVVEDEERLGRTQEPLCASSSDPPRPVANVVVPGKDNAVTSGTYDYGDGPCDGYVVKFVSLARDNHISPTVALDGGVVSANACSSTRIASWIWVRWNGGQWVYRGFEETTPHLWPDGKCLGSVQTTLTPPTAPQKYDWEVVVKGQVRTTTTVTMPGGGTISTAVNKPASFVVAY